MTKHVRVIFDRRKKAAKVETGFIDKRGIAVLLRIH